MTPEFQWQGLIGTLIGPALLALLVVAIIWDRRRRRGIDGCVIDGPEDEPYKVFTREFDLELDARELPTRIGEASPDFYRGWTDRHGDVWQRNRLLTASFAGRQPSAEALIQPLAQSLACAEILGHELAVTLLVDQSGSMRGKPIAATAAAVGAVSRALATLDIPHEILGFSTAGWHGGHAAEAWRRAGEPKRPGRLCAVLHIVYKRFDEPSWDERSQDAFVHPDILRENVDGEALEWAAARLSSTASPRRILLVLSDGAPVDDRTMLTNGLHYLDRAARRSIAAIEADEALSLGAVGISDERGVFTLYPRLRETPHEEIACTTVDLLAELIDPPSPTGQNLTAP
jgi:cobaltochelatase CobT